MKTGAGGNLSHEQLAQSRKEAAGVAIQVGAPLKEARDASWRLPCSPLRTSDGKHM